MSDEYLLDSIAMSYPLYRNGPENDRLIDNSYVDTDTIQGTITYPTKREVRKIIDSKVSSVGRGHATLPATNIA